MSIVYALGTLPEQHFYCSQSNDGQGLLKRIWRPISKCRHEFCESFHPRIVMGEMSDGLLFIIWTFMFKRRDIVFLPLVLNTKKVRSTLYTPRHDILLFIIAKCRAWNIIFQNILRKYLQHLDKDPQDKNFPVRFNYKVLGFWYFIYYNLFHIAGILITLTSRTMIHYWN